MAGCAGLYFDLPSLTAREGDIITKEVIGNVIIEVDGIIVVVSLTVIIRDARRSPIDVSLIEVTRHDFALGATSTACEGLVVDVDVVARRSLIGGGASLVGALGDFARVNASAAVDRAFGSGFVPWHHNRLGHGGEDEPLDEALGLHCECCWWLWSGKFGE